MNLGTFTDYYQRKLKNNLYKKRRLQGISDYFYEEHGQNVTFSTIDECYAFITNFVDNNEDSEIILDQIYSVLEHTFYSSQNMYYIYDFSTSYNSIEFHRNLVKLFRKSVEYRDFTFSLIGVIQFDEIEGTIHLDLEYEEVYFDYLTEENKRKYKQLIRITFDFKNEKFISLNSSYEKSHKVICECLRDKGYDISPIYVLKRAVTLKNKNFTDFSPVTLLVINLLLKTIPSMDYTTLKLDSINFTNYESANIQKMTLNGTDLLKAPEVLQRIHSGDTVHNFKISLGKLIREDDGHEIYFNTSFKIDLSGRLSFVFGDDHQDEDKNREICIELKNKIIDIIYDDNSVEQGLELIQQNLPKPQSFNDIVSVIKKDILELIGDTDKKVIIEKYFVDKYAIK